MERTHDVPVPVERRTRRNNYLIRNQTPHELVLLGPARKNGAMLVLRLSPLQRRSIGGHPVKLFSDAASFAQLDHAVDWEAEPVRGTRMLTMAWLAGIAFAGPSLVWSAARSGSEHGRSSPECCGCSSGSVWYSSPPGGSSRARTTTCSAPRWSRHAPGVTGGTCSVTSQSAWFRVWSAYC